ncbi:hypothetical protein [Neobacillus sp. YIM B06451]|uniref:hypothetical protein n=1 Tax=Neobacillus sp. YIM B06451 TaxID=3070994 RepID=UPI00292F60BC|nr:hypothetical protein [Neobacillus sp. YIM B06451]
MVAKAAKKAKILHLSPYENAAVDLAENQTRLVLGEWDSKAGKEIQEPDWYQIEGTVNRLDTRIFLIHVETDGGKATYLTKVKVKKWHSYQELLNPDFDGYTLIVFSSEATGIGDLALNLQKYTSHEVKGTLPEIQEKYPELEIRNLPTAFIINGMTVIFKSEDISELRTLITDVKTFEFVGENENWHVELEGKQTLSRRDAEFFITYRGNEEITGDIDVTLNGDNWGWGAGAVMPLSDTLSISGKTPVFLSKSDKLSVVLRWDGKEERITLEFIGEK